MSCARCGARCQGRKCRECERLDAMADRQEMREREREADDDD